MSKLVCCSCGNVFSEDEIETWYEYHGFEFGGEKWSGSPCCKGYYVEACECDCCGEYIATDKYVEIDDKKYCWNCVDVKNLEDI